MDKPITLALRRQRREDQKKKFKAFLVYISSLKLAWAIWDLNLKKKKDFNSNDSNTQSKQEALYYTLYRAYILCAVCNFSFLELLWRAHWLSDTDRETEDRLQAIRLIWIQSQSGLPLICAAQEWCCLLLEPQQTTGPSWSLSKILAKQFGTNFSTFSCELQNFKITLTTHIRQFSNLYDFFLNIYCTSQGQVHSL